MKSRYEVKCGVEYSRMSKEHARRPWETECASGEKARILGSQWRPQPV